jgi:Family of unknown function (DUF6165)
MTDERARLTASKNTTAKAPHKRNRPPPILAPISVGELIDKIVILEIKKSRVSDPAKLAEVLKELNLLNRIGYGSDECRHHVTSLKEELRQINEALWEIEDRIRDCERRRDFGPRFVQLARAVYITNDRRAAVKRHINEVSGSALKEVKELSSY